MQGGPHDNNTAAKAVCFGEALKPEFKQYAMQIVKNAKALAEELKNQGVNLVSGGTDTHLILIDLTGTGCTGKEAEAALEKVNITVNKNMVPFDKRTPFDPSGIRIGTPAITTRGMKEQEMKQIAQMIALVVKNPNDKKISKKVKKQVLEMCKKFPLK
jgi:glycine hydroxymethyltransferase